MGAIKKVLIANRGEIAVRIIRACRELGVASVAVYSEADQDSLHVQLADEAVCVGPASSKDSYLHMPNIISAAIITGADAIHPGYGYFSESPSFTEACEACNLQFIGPPASAIESMGDKAKAREIVEKAKVPVIPGAKGIITNEQEAMRTASRMGFPLLIKASAGGGGRGIRRVDRPDDLLAALRTATTEAEAAFGVGDVYMEKLIEKARHVEVQVLADKHGACVHLGERECSIQNNRRQKMIEEAPCPVLDEKTRHAMGEAAVRAAKAVGYFSAGTIEFLVDSERNFYFMEMNTRIQVEHPVTEATVGLDLVKLQLAIANGEKLPFSQKDIRPNGHAIECRITAEDPDNDFKPSSGTISKLNWPGGPGVRIDSYVYQDYTVPPYYDPLLGKLIVWGHDRTEAIDRMLRCLSELQVEGIKTNAAVHAKILQHADYRKGEFTTNFVTNLIASNGRAAA
ncbi:MAG: acetyl-CoA carboxylase biotin carboxylase subunit [Armatimonadetes bacterium]|nr:acetyl-CoA carboxylase biotin carboxylase subunit [Armatimonadota bacterium]